MGSEALIVDESIAPDETALKRLTQIAKLPDVVKIVGQPDLHQGEQETPTSIVTATKETIYPELSSNVINCGMSVIATDLSTDDITNELVSKFCTELVKQSKIHHLSRTDAVRMLRYGAECVPDRWDCDRGLLDNIENGGSMLKEDSRLENLSDIVPPWLLRYKGTYENTPVPSLAGNHFIEFQAVDEILDSDTAAEWGLAENQILIALHGDYSLTSTLNWHYSNRLKFREQISSFNKFKMQASKAVFHLTRGGPIRFRRNWRLYNNTEQYTPFLVSSREGQQISAVINAAMNFAYANRLLSVVCIKKALLNINQTCGPTNFLWDVGHDTIQKETIGGEEYWIHRKGAAKAVPGKPAYVSGSYNMNSFLGKGEEGARTFLNSYDHGCSNVIAHFESEHNLVNIDQFTKMFSLSTGVMTNEIQHVDPEPIETTIQTLSDNDVVSGVAWLRPVGNVGK